MVTNSDMKLIYENKTLEANEISFQLSAYGSLKTELKSYS